MGSIKQVIIIKASPKEVYDAFMDSKKYSLFTGDKAIISKKIGGKFSAFGGWASGENLELIEGKKIVQSWRASDWKEGHYSRIIINLEKVDNGTKIIFEHEGVPDKWREDIEKGWNEYYWKPLKKMLEKD